jgi:predicted MFS family arabinose efflux permease
MWEAAMGQRSKPRVGPLRATLSALCASLVGIGLARFAYTPLIPALISAQWFTPSEAAYLGAANLAGYLAGALLAVRTAARLPPVQILRSTMALATVAFFACAWPVSFLWFFAWRFAAGLAGGALMVLAAPVVLPHVPPRRRGLAGGVIFTGVGLGIGLSGTLLPPLLHAGLVEAWCGLGSLALLLTLIAWNGWPEDRAPPLPTPAGERSSTVGLALAALFVTYGLNAVGLVPHMVFLVDFVARGLGEGVNAGARYWVLFGLGATVGPVLAGYLADRIGFGPALRLALLVQAACVALLAVADGAAARAVSSLVVGACVPGVVPLALGRVQELIATDAQARRKAWSIATTAFAVGQAGAAYGFSFLFAWDGGYTLLFGLGAAALLTALAIDLAVASLPDRAKADRPLRPPARKERGR